MQGPMIHQIERPSSSPGDDGGGKLGLTGGMPEPASVPDPGSMPELNSPEPEPESPELESSTMMMKPLCDVPWTLTRAWTADTSNPWPSQLDAALAVLALCVMA